MANRKLPIDKTKIFLVLICLALTGCDNGVSEKRGVARIELFKNCMDLAAKMPRQSDDDVSDIVGSCGIQADYMTNYIE